jgi:hypothetical protein
MLITIKLDQQISCENICNSLQRALNSYQQSNTIDNNTLLVIEVKTIIDEQRPILNIEHKNI